MNEPLVPQSTIEDAPMNAGEQLADTLRQLLPEVTGHLLRIATLSRPLTRNGTWDARGLSNIFRLNNVCIGYIKALAELRKAQGIKDEPLQKMGQEQLLARLNALEGAIAQSHEAMKDAKTIREAGGVAAMKKREIKAMIEPSVKKLDL